MKARTFQDTTQVLTKIHILLQSLLITKFLLHILLHTLFERKEYS